ncbi:YeeE/YedE family protein [Litorimonas haliclonae]|uniref:YeeE/YedE family protein n=1 Tax=Litorimonas haliclonae TaxID=2081977 RepID=UPI0039EDEFF0
MENFTPISASIGGVLIGLSAVLLMGSAGRIAGISGILGGLFSSTKADRGWRIAFLAGLVLGPFLAALWKAEFLSVNFPVTGPLLVIAGVLVGLGTQIGGGCTSGHGVCGNARLSMRSVIATLTFMTTGVVTVFILRHVVGA